MTPFEILMVAGMAIVTFGVRYPVLALVTRIPLPAPLLNALKYVPTAVLTAIIVPAVVMPSGHIDIMYTNAYLVAALASGLIAWRTKDLLLTIVLGMAIFIGLHWLV